MADMHNAAAPSAQGFLDAHTHILPGMDDGSRDPETSLEMLRKIMAQGVEAVALTPHFYPNREAPEEFLRRRERAAQQLQHAAGNERLPRALIGAEVAYFEGVSRVKAMRQMCIGTSQVLLVEMPFCTWTSRMLNDLVILREQEGITPLLAHVERYLSFHNQSAMEDMRQAGCLIQCNASFFLRGLGSFNAMRMMKKGQISLIGSDCHNLGTRPPNLAHAVEKIRARCGEEALERLKRNQTAVLK